MLSSILPASTSAAEPFHGPAGSTPPVLDVSPLPSGERSLPELKTRLHWLMGLRVAIVTLMLGLSLAFQSTRGESAPTFTALIVFTYTITIVYAVVLRRLTTAVAYTAFIWVQVGVDVILETVLIARTGGVESPFAVLYVITVTVASLVPHRRVGIVTGAGCTLLFGGITAVQYFGLLNASTWLPPSKLEGPEALQTFEVYGLAFLVVGFLSGVLADELRHADQSLREKEQGLSRLQVFHESIVRSISNVQMRTFKQPMRTTNTVRGPRMHQNRS